jgi:ABC-2 type transport system permease protein
VNERLRRFLLRVRALASKEVRHIVRDPQSLYLGLGMPVVLLVLMGAGMSFDLDRIPLAVADLDHTRASRALVEAFTADGTFRVAGNVADADGAEAMFRSYAAAGALVIPAGFARDLDRGERVDVQFLVDGVDGNSAGQVLSKADAVAMGARLTVSRGQPMEQLPPIAAAAWTRFNPAGRSALYLVPGLGAFVLALGAVLLTALTVAREWERGSMEQLFATPVGRLEIVIGKLLPYLAMGIVQFLTVLVAGAWGFGLPLKGDFVLLSVCALLFLVAMLGQGLLISVVTRNQMVASQLAMMMTMLPTMMLSGFILPIENMPLPVRALSEILPARHMVTILRGILLKDNGIGELWTDVLALALYAVAMLTLSTRRFQRRLA